ncbi:DUF1707 domain-containing protein [Dactylosporangium sucinum]|uniref:DUF1707 domain-containing protein n=1 Tax=Dactylosporangium sucinum TaxID=1424081 RepID=A0A917T8J1_9ACTN|nr:DUF1707 domain-containing protein [Dactylosporangium sucinum]GGM13814.1 hypothetical protein GCM10007977_013570 [Dactylosporangium sucinum]
MTGERVRASDAEREQYANMVRAGMTEGRLTLEEGEERLGQVYAAKYRDELPPLTADLPEGGRRGLRETPEAKQAFMHDGRRHLRRHAGFVFALAILLTGLWWLSGAHFFWPAIPLFFLVLSVFKHARWRRWVAENGGVPPWHGREHGHRHGRWDRGPWAAASDRQGWSR